MCRCLQSEINFEINIIGKKNIFPVFIKTLKLPTIKMLQHVMQQ